MEEDIHQHCLGCIKIWKCSYRPEAGRPCEIIPCDIDCGARFHACKRKEHQLLCPNEKVPCINAGNGCPSLLQRKFLGVHLKICPASVIYCTMEWNRWPIQDGRSRFSRQIHQRAFHQTQLDVALAMRDQRMLWRRWRSSRYSRESFKNALIKKASTELSSHPFSLYDCESSEIRHALRCPTNDEKELLWESKKHTSHPQQTIYSELYKASRKASETLTAALSVITEYSDVNTISGACNGVSDSFSVMSNAVGDLQSHEENKENIMDYLNYNEIMNNSSRCKHDSTMNMYNQPLPMEYSTFGDFCTQPDGSTRRLRNGNSQSANEFNLEKVLEILSGCNVVFANDTTVSDISSASILDHARKDVIPPVNSLFDSSENSSSLSSTLPWCITLGLDLNLESFTRYKAKPRSMYTFLCAQVFRRDEYAWHYKNVHGDIHGGLNGWLEERCPLAQYGCMFSRRRFYPAPEGSNIVHNITLESFGVKPPNLSLNCNETLDLRCLEQSNYDKSMESEIIHNNHADNSEVDSDESFTPPINITQLPFEILQHMARFLDSFSLCNLSLTSSLLRDVCRSLLEERGVVIFQWERQRKCDGYSWRVAHKRWFFSSSFTPIKQWSFEDSNNMANHLKTCAYFKRNLKCDPYYYPMGLEPNDRTYQKLRDHAADIFRNARENVSTKL